MMDAGRNLSYYRMASEDEDEDGNPAKRDHTASDADDGEYTYRNTITQLRPYVRFFNPDRCGCDLTSSQSFDWL